MASPSFYLHFLHGAEHFFWGGGACLYILQRSVYSNPLPTFQLGYLSFSEIRRDRACSGWFDHRLFAFLLLSCTNSLYILDTGQVNDLQIFSPIL